jgi:phage gp46-like protein
MTDIRILQTATLEAVTLDWLLQDNGTLDETQALASAVTVALGTDRLALIDDALPDLDDDDRRGWWGDLDAEELYGAWPVGSRLWLMSRSKIVGQGAEGGATTFNAEAYVKEALQPFVQRGIFSRYEVHAVRIDRSRIDVSVVIYRGPLPAIELKYQSIWDEIRQ